MDLYLFDFDKTLYDYNFLRRLPALAISSGVSQYRLASEWWAAGYEARAEAGEWPSTELYLEQFARVTGAQLTKEQWLDARRAAMTAIPGSIAALRRAASLGTVSLFSNNPSIFTENFGLLAPEVADILGPNVVTSCILRARKPTPTSYERVLEHFGAAPENTFFADDNRPNITGALDAGIAGHHFTTPELLDEAITAFAGRTR